MTNNIFSGIKEVELVIGEWAPRDLALINRIIYDSLRAELILFGSSQKRSNSWPDFEKAFNEICLTFKGVSNLHLKGIVEGEQQIMGFDIIYPTVDGGYFEIQDYEAGIISFICESISVKLVDKWGQI